MLKTRSRLIWIGGALVVLLAILLAISVTVSWIAGARLERRLSELRAAGEPTCLADLDREPISAAQNAAALLRRIRNELRAVQDEWYRTKNQDFSADALTDEQLEMVRDTLAAYPNVIPTIRQAAVCPDYVPLCDYTLPPQQFISDLQGRINCIRGAARTMNAYISLQLADGQRDQALDSAVDLLRLTRPSDREPMIIGFLVSMACRSIAVDATTLVLGDGPVGQSSRSDLDAELAQHDAMEGLRWALRSERAYGLDSFRQQTGNSWRGLFMSPVKRAIPSYLDFIDHELRLGAAPWYQTRRHNHWIYSDISSLPPLVRNLVPATNAMRQAMNRVRAELRCLRVLNALQGLSSQSEATDVNRADLSLPDQATTDPFTGQPLRITKTDQGWLIYSLGDDGIDNGGSLDDLRDVGLRTGQVSP